MLQVQKLEEELRTKAAQAGKAKDPIKEYELLHTGHVCLNGLTDAAPFKKGMETVAASDLYKKAIADRSATLQQETSQKQVLLAAFQNQGSDWWTKVTDQYKISTKPSDKRLLGFISLAAYSYSAQLLQQKNIEAASHILAIYEMADANNTDQLYFHAQLYALLGNTDISIQYLQRAVKNGFTDRAKVEAEPAFITVRSDKHFNGLWSSRASSK
jgi:hypothetical protein